MDKINFQNLPNTTTPVNATNLNLLQTNVDNGKVDVNANATNNIDANNLKKSGFYYLGTGCSNVPASYVRIMVNGSSNTTDVSQIAVALSLSSLMWVRKCSNNNWTEWYPIVTVYESGSNTNGKYIKYSDGTMICTKQVTGTTSITESWGSGYTTGSTNTISLGSFAASFYSAPTVTITPSRPSGGGNNYWLATNQGVTTSSAGSVSLLRFTSNSSVSYVLDVIAIGRWKA